jgi:hypothetical protein
MLNSIRLVLGGGVVNNSENLGWVSGVLGSRKFDSRINLGV